MASEQCGHWSFGRREGRTGSLPGSLWCVGTFDITNHACQVGARNSRLEAMCKIAGQTIQESSSIPQSAKSFVGTTLKYNDFLKNRDQF